MQCLTRRIDGGVIRDRARRVEVLLPVGWPVIREIFSRCIQGCACSVTISAHRTARQQLHKVPRKLEAFIPQDRNGAAVGA